MGKPPKHAGGIPPAVSPSPTTIPVLGGLADTRPIQLARPYKFSGENPVFAETTASLSQTPGHPPSVLVNNIPAPYSLTVEAILRTIAWPADQVHLLKRLDIDDGLSVSPDGQLYAHVENAGNLPVEQLGNGRYQLSLPFVPHLAGTFLIKTERQSVWTFERPDWLAHDTGNEQLDMAADVTPEPMYLSPDDAALLTPRLHSTDGIRYDKHRKTYVDTAQGTVMVRKNAAGQYQQSSATARNASALLFEQIPGTRMWQGKTAQSDTEPESSWQEKTNPATQGSDKSRHQEQSANATRMLTESLLSAHPATINLRFGLWRNWGQNIRPPLGQHIEIDGQYYRVMQQDLNADPRLVYLQHPLFSPALYDAFEYMLRDNPSLQPKWAVRNNDQWTVLDNVVPFEMPITQYISRAFKYLSDQSVSALARAMFNQANQSEIINGSGLALMNQVFRFWANRDGYSAPRGELAEPLLMLRSLSPLAMPASRSEGLMRLDFDPGRFSRHWNEYAAEKTAVSLRKLFSRLLEDAGYGVIRSRNTRDEDVLLFYRENIDHVFVLQLPSPANGNLQQRALENIQLSEAQRQLWVSDQKPLSAYQDEQNISFLLGGVQTDIQRQTSLFVTKIK
jgi:hypothetical protein